MTTQPGLFDGPLAPPTPAIQPLPKRRTYSRKAEQFEAFHLLNPHVFQAILTLARELRDQHGFERGGMKMIFERLRWLYKLRTQGDEYTLNNNYTSYYARLVMVFDPTFEDWFYLRKMREAWDPDLEALGLVP